MQYLQRPEEVFAEALRVLKPGGVFIVSFSNRMFPDKAIAAWRDASDYAHVALVKSYFQAVDGFGPPDSITQVCPTSAPPQLHTVPHRVESHRTATQPHRKQPLVSHRGVP